MDDLVRAERMGTESGIDDVLAARIATDGRFKEDLEYMDEKADQMSQRKPGAADKARNVAIMGK